MMGVQEDVPVTTESSGGGKGGSGPTRDALVTGEDSYLMAQQIKNQLDLQEKELDELLAKVNNDKAYFRSLPNQWPTSGEISSYYGWRKSPFGGRSESFHDGIDIANDSGTEVCAAADGQVVFAGWQPVYGRTILIEHGHGFATKYAHNSALLVEEGDRVKKGQVIARMGTSGRSTGPHLHFSIMKWDQTLDPLIYLPDPLGE
jgi:murein DD-endopeptidase MepM/ murein hydrolase activator NlpD